MAVRAITVLPRPMSSRSAATGWESRKSMAKDWYSWGWNFMVLRPCRLT